MNVYFRTPDCDIIQLSNCHWNKFFEQSSLCGEESMIFWSSVNKTVSRICKIQGIRVFVKHSFNSLYSL